MLVTAKEEEFNQSMVLYVRFVYYEDNNK